MENINSNLIRQIVEEAIRDFQPEGIATTQQTMRFAGIRSRATLNAWEREGTFPERVVLKRNADGSPSSVGWRWDELYKWRDSLPRVQEAA